jgi:hypothetical protein
LIIVTGSFTSRYRKSKKYLDANLLPKEGEVPTAVLYKCDHEFSIKQAIALAVA